MKRAFRQGFLRGFPRGFMGLRRHLTPLLLVWFATLAAGAALGQPVPAPVPPTVPQVAAAMVNDIAAMAGELLQNHRKSVVLSAATGAQRADAREAGHYLFFRNQHLVQALVAAITTTDAVTAARPGVASRYQALARVMDDAAPGGADRLAFAGTLNALSRSRSLGAAEEADVQRRLAGLRQVRAQLGVPFRDAFAEVPLPAASPQRPFWNAYVRELSARFPVPSILAELDAGTAPSTVPPDRAEEAARGRLREWDGVELPGKVVLLSFDDGPHPVHTAAILDILRQHAVPAVFFLIGRNLKDMPRYGPELLPRLRAEGHAIGNHSWSHPQLPQLAPAALAREIGDTRELIAGMAAGGSVQTNLFRAPYGARNEGVLGEVEHQGLRSVLWNIDSEDWSDPVPESIAHRVVQETERQGRGIILLHDIHARTVQALPLIITELKRRGYVFARMEDGRVTAEAPPRGVSPTAPASPRSP